MNEQQMQNSNRISDLLDKCENVVNDINQDYYESIYSKPLETSVKAAAVSKTP